MTAVIRYLDVYVGSDSMYFHSTFCCPLSFSFCCIPPIHKLKETKEQLEILRDQKEGETTYLSKATIDTSFAGFIYQ